MIPTAGSGNMVPLPMGEFVQQSYKEIAVEVEYDLVDWGIMLTAMRGRPDAPNAPHRDVINHGLPISDPTQFFLNFMGLRSRPTGRTGAVTATRGGRAAVPGAAHLRIGGTRRADHPGA